MLAIGIQTIPEGLAVSVAAINAGLDRRAYAAFAGVRAGAVEIPLAVIGALAVGAATGLLPYTIGFAAGAMLFVISDEIIPETHTRGYKRIATIGTMLGSWSWCISTWFSQVDGFRWTAMVSGGKPYFFMTASP